MKRQLCEKMNSVEYGLCLYRDLVKKEQTALAASEEKHRHAWFRRLFDNGRLFIAGTETAEDCYSCLRVQAK